ncbi:MAG: hypothetical protein VCA34_15240 [Roseibacillus sp.]
MKGPKMIVVTRQALVLASLGMMLASCSSANPDGAPHSELKTAIDHPQGHRIFFQDGENRHVISLHDDGSYLFKSGDQSGVVTSKRDGQWTWKRKGTHAALLKLDEDEWRLTFVGPDSAMAVNLSAQGSTQVFQFEPF